MGDLRGVEELLYFIICHGISLNVGTCIKVFINNRFF